jgi:hypothetical protein
MNLLTVVKGENGKKVNEITEVSLQKSKGNKCRNTQEK